MKKHVCLYFIGFLTSFSCFCQDGEITIEQDPMIVHLITLKSEMTKNNAFGERYKIQIFYGSSAEAAKVLREFKKEHPDWAITMTYQPPNYKVWVGDFRNRLEADRAFLKIKDDFGSAFIFKPNMFAGK